MYQSLTTNQPLTRRSQSCTIISPADHSIIRRRLRIPLILPHGQAAAINRGWERRSGSSLTRRCPRRPIVPPLCHRQLRVPRQVCMHSQALVFRHLPRIILQVPLSLYLILAATLLPLASSRYLRDTQHLMWVLHSITLIQRQRLVYLTHRRSLQAKTTVFLSIIPL